MGVRRLSPRGAPDGDRDLTLAGASELERVVPARAVGHVLEGQEPSGLATRQEHRQPQVLLARATGPAELDPPPGPSSSGGRPPTPAAHSTRPSRTATSCRYRTNRTETWSRTGSPGDFQALPRDRHFCPSREVSTAQHSSFPSDMVGPYATRRTERPRLAGRTGRPNIKTRRHHSERRSSAWTGV